VGLTDLHATMALIRAFETEVARLYRDGVIPGFVHTSLGQEAVATGVCAALAPGDHLTTTHRGHGHVLAKGADPDGMMAELFGRASGLCGGKGGSMHVADPSVGILGANAIVGAGIPIATGAGLSSKILRTGAVAVSFFGEGAVNQGAFHEAVNLAAIWSLPVLFLCENNRYAEFTDSARMTRVPDVRTRAGAYGIWARQVDGNDVRAVHEVARDAVELCRDGQGPALIEAATYRWHGHYEGDGQPYKPEPRRRHGGPATRSCSPRRHSSPKVRPRSRSSPASAARPSSAYDAPSSSLEQPPCPPSRRPTSMSSPPDTAVRYSEAIGRGLARAIEDDERVVLLGIDVGAGGGIFTVTRGLHERFGSSRILDTPISEMG
jgi:TPP-dependent pyruvate/acetoin dehydrogenase alpha subunit